MEMSSKNVRFCSRSRGPHIVNRSRIIDINYGLVDCAQSKRQIVVLKIKKDFLVKTIKSVKQRTTDHKDCAFNEFCATVTHYDIIRSRSLPCPRLQSTDVAKP